jgi:carbamoyltransferase
MYEEAFFALLGHAGSPGLSDLALAGGCAMNSVANGKILRRTDLKRLFVPPAAGDAGGAIGAALATWHALGGMRETRMDHAAWGPEFDEQALAAALADHAEEIGRHGCALVRLEPDELCRRVARALADGEVVGWFQGRMEWGPRALGGRSILGDPRRGDMKSILNEKIKRRESFRPFAPSILDEHVAEWFEDDAPAPFMTQVYPVREERRARIPAVTHVDGSGRLQTVSRQGNELYHRLIECFFAETGVPMVLNTSFNENEPVVCRPEQALDCFLRTRMDRLALGPFLLSRSAAP